MTSRMGLMIGLIISCYGYSLEFSVGAKQHAALQVLVAVCGPNQDHLSGIANQIAQDLSLSGQLQVKVIAIPNLLHKKSELKHLAEHATPVALLLSAVPGRRYQFEWRLYDLLEQKMLVGKKTSFQGSVAEVAHLTADQVWQQLMGRPGEFTSVIVACRKLKVRGKNQQHIYAFHATKLAEDQLQILPLVTMPTISLAPRWHSKKGLLYYSQHTPTNVRLMVVNNHKQHRIVTNFDGLNLTPAISPDGKVVLSLSSGGCEKLYQYDFERGHQLNQFEALTDGQMSAISPSFIDENQLVFCAIDKVTNLPRIALLNLKQKTATFLTGKEFCVSPAYCPALQKIAYCKRVRGVMQVFCYDLKRKEHVQVTFDAGDKDECSWSPQGDFIVMTVDRDRKSRIGLWNMAQSQMTYLTPKSESWCFPAWSPCYPERLFIG